MINQMKKLWSMGVSAKVFCNHQKNSEGNFEVSDASKVRILKSLLIFDNKNSEFNTGPVTIMIFEKHPESNY